jgi:DNA-binding NarL/FixJ family response regulator
MPSSPGLFSSPGKKPRVLIVDDVPQVRQDLRLLLELSGSLEIVGEAASGQDAITQIEINYPDVVLMDLEMPLMDGYEATRQIKARWPNRRVIAFSVHSYAMARQKAIQAGCDGFIEKGASLDMILDTLKSEGDT